MKKLEKLAGSKFELSKSELEVFGGYWKKSYQDQDTAPEDGGGCDKVTVDRCWIISASLSSF